MVYEAATRRMTALRTLPDEIQRRFETALEGIAVPGKGGSRDQFLEMVSTICANHSGLISGLAELPRLQELSAPAGIKNDEMALYIRWIDELYTPTRLRNNVLFQTIRRITKDITENFAFAGGLIKAALASPRPSAYMRLLAREGFDIVEFARSVRLFTHGGRKIVFTHIDAEQEKTRAKIMELARERKEIFLPDVQAHLERLKPDVFISDGQMGDQEDIRLICIRLILTMYGVYMFGGRGSRMFLLPFEDEFHDFGINAYKVSNPEMLDLLPSEPEEKGEYVLGGFTDWMDIVLGSNDGSLVQHELQHLFDNIIRVAGKQTDREYRATLAELAFDENVGERYRSMEYQSVGDQVFRALEMRAFKSWPAHREAQLLILRQIRPMCNDDPAAIKARALLLLNRAYREACGLSYDEIIEPFKRMEE